jgi:predicted metalloprotease
MKTSVRRCLALLLVVGAVVSTGVNPASAARTRKVAKVVSLRTPFTETAGTYGATVAKFGADLDAFWSVELPRVYKQAYRPLVGFYPYSSQNLPPRCGTTMRFQDIAGNAFYCRVADYIAFDNEGLFPDLYNGFGDIALGMVLAHEVGHAVQARTKTRLPSVYAELQADCFAGAWLRRVSDGKSPLFTLDNGVIEDALSATLAFRDRPGIGADAAGAHGNGFDRTGAVQLGYDEGTSRCAAFRSNPPTVTATSFTAASEAASGGDVPLDEAVRIATVTANRHFASIPGFVAITALERSDRTGVLGLPKQCPAAALILGQRVGVCPDTGGGQPLLRVSEAALEDAQKVGDVGASMVLVLGWTARVQQLLGEPTRDTSVSAELRSTCLAGTWLGATQRGETGTADDPVSLSPGDVDEALITLIRAGGASTTFDRVRALRIGFSTKAPFTACSKF